MSMVVRTQDNQFDFKMFETPFIRQRNIQKRKTLLFWCRLAEKSSMSIGAHARFYFVNEINNTIIKVWYLANTIFCGS